MGILFALFALLGWGTTDFLAALSSRKIGNITTLIWITFGGLLIFLLYAFITHLSFSLPLIPLIILCLAGVMQTVGGLSFYKAFEVGEVSLASPIGSSFAVWTVVLSLLFAHEKLSLLQGFAIIIVIVGTFFVSTNFSLLRKGLHKAFTDKGIIFALLASFFWGVSFAIYAPILRQYGWLISVITMRSAILMCGIIVATISRKKVLRQLSHLPFKLLLIASVTDFIAFAGFSIGLAHGFTSIVSPIAAAFPLVTVVMAQIILKEKIALNQFIGILGIICGVILLSF